MSGYALQETVIYGRRRRSAGYRWQTNCSAAFPRLVYSTNTCHVVGTAHLYRPAAHCPFPSNWPPATPLRPKWKWLNCPHMTQYKCGHQNWRYISTARRGTSKRRQPLAQWQTQRHSSHVMLYWCSWLRAVTLIAGNPGFIALSRQAHCHSLTTNADLLTRGTERNRRKNLNRVLRESRQMIMLTGRTFTGLLYPVYCFIH
jgi:hypothetical protein